MTPEMQAIQDILSQHPEIVIIRSNVAYDKDNNVVIENIAAIDSRLQQG
jgi:hypothetical protein